MGSLKAQFTAEQMRVIPAAERATGTRFDCAEFKYPHIRYYLKGKLVRAWHLNDGYLDEYGPGVWEFRDGRLIEVSVG